MKGNLYTLIYAAILGSVCAALLAGAGKFTAPFQKANEEAEEKRNVLAVLGVPFDPNSSAGEILDTFSKSVREGKLGELEPYIFAEQGETRAVAISFAGPGLWGPIEGYLSLAPDMKTIRGVTFHKQEETPGLGGEIASDWFRRQFEGKSIMSADGTPGIDIVRGKGASGPSRVDGITGATMTCDKVEAMLNNVMAKIVKERGENGR